MTYRTTRDLALSDWCGGSFTLPAGSRATLVKRLSGVTGDGFAAADVAQLKRLSGNSHDPVYRYAVLPADAITGDTPAELEAIERVKAARP